MQLTQRPNRILLSARVSRTVDNSTSISRQLTDGREYAARRWPGVPVLEFVDDGVSGAVEPAKRPGFGELMRIWAPGDVVLAWRLDRYNRSTLKFLELAQTAMDAGVGLATVRDGIDLSTAEGRLLAQLLAVFAEFEREQIKSRVASTRRTLHKTGRWAGGRVPYGLKIASHPSGEGKVLVRDPDAAEVIREIVKRVTDGEGITSIARDLQERSVPSPRVHTSVKANPKPSAWASASIRDILGHPNIVGHQVDPMTGRLVRENGLPVEVWEPVVSVEELDLAVSSLPAQTGRAATKDRHWLYAVATCGECTRNMHVNRNDRAQAPAFKCYGTNRERHGAVTARVQDVEDLVNGSILEHLGGAFYAERKWVGGQDSAGDVERLRAFLAELEEDRKAGLYSTPEGRERFRRQYRETEEEIQELEARPVVESGWQVVPTEDRLADVWERWTPEERGAWLREWNVRVEVSRPAVKRARVPLAERSTIDWGGLTDLYLELDALRVDMD